MCPLWFNFNPLSGMALEVTGKIIAKLPQQSGQGRNGTWVKQEFVIETNDQYPRKICMSLWGDKVKDLDALSVGESIKASVNIESREFNGRWYTDVRAWRLEKLGVNQGGDVPPFPEPDQFPPFLEPTSSPVPADDLPF